MINIQENIPLAKYTTFGIGGPAKFFVEVKRIEELKEAVKYAKDRNLEFFVLGGGSNLLVSDAGFDGLAIRMSLGQISIDADSGIVEVDAGVPFLKLVRDTAENSLTGLEWAAGIPGTVGGAIRGNAGAFGGEMKDVIEIVRVLDTQSTETKEMACAECNFKYRDSFFKYSPQLVILGARIKLARGDRAESRKKIEETIAGRVDRHPGGFGSAGSYFINPIVNNPKLVAEFENETGKKSKEGKIPSGWLIEKSGMKGKKIGGAMVSSEHANYIINTGNATAEDITALDSLVKQQVRDKLGVQLQEEVRYLGF
jgi:UDP-N-acetylmuramate dehydrogenase